ncbi:MAG: hypothetical protein QNJ70_24520 [Xenococcaceae cyanobacterium MO_207.B15]|nr:hypothetical protein [Xenococcaceae cyanobacterium MO_207.B15]
MAWFKTARYDLKRGKIDQLIEQMKQVRKASRGSRRKIITSQIYYFNKPLATGLFNYDKIAQLNLPIGSGAVEVCSVKLSIYASKVTNDFKNQGVFRKR